MSHIIALTNSKDPNAYGVDEARVSAGVIEIHLAVDIKNAGDFSVDLSRDEGSVSAAEVQSLHVLARCHPQPAN